MTKRVVASESSLPLYTVPFEEFVGTLRAILNAVPVEYRRRATVELTVEDDYDGAHVVSIATRYEREETPEEQAARLLDEASKRKEEEERERAEFKRLKEKFEPHVKTVAEVMEELGIDDDPGCPNCGGLDFGLMMRRDQSTYRVCPCGWSEDTGKVEKRVEPRRQGYHSEVE